MVTTLAGTAGEMGSADGTGTDAQFLVPEGVAVSSAGNVYVADTFNNTIRKITPAGVVTTLAGTAGMKGSVDGTGTAAQFDHPVYLAADGAGNVYVADFENNTIRKITPAGVVSTLAGTAGTTGTTDGTGPTARFGGPSGLGVDSVGNVYVADVGNQTIRKITPAGVTTTIGGVAGEVGVVLGSSPHFSEPKYLAISGDALVISDANGILLLRHVVHD